MNLSQKSPLSVIWQTSVGDYTEFELEWITEVLLRGVFYERIMDCGRLETLRDGALVVYSSNLSEVGESFRRYLDRFVDSGFSFHLLHLSNENLGHDCSYYSKARHVFRNYFDPAITSSNVTFLPLGFQSGFLNRDGLVSSPGERTLDAAFVGQPKNDRIDLITAISRLRSPFLHLTKAWSCTTALSPVEVSRIYARTRYVPCPKGWIHEDSFRICEALEWGAVPVLRNYVGPDVFARTLPGHPFPVIDSWEDLPALIASTDYEVLHRECREWYLAFREDLTRRMAGILSPAREGLITLR